MLVTYLGMCLLPTGAVPMVLEFRLTHVMLILVCHIFCYGTFHE